MRKCERYEKILPRLPLPRRHLSAGDCRLRRADGPAGTRKRQFHSPGNAGSDLRLHRDGYVPEPDGRGSGGTVSGPRRIYERGRFYRYRRRNGPAGYDSVRAGPPCPCAAGRGGVRGGGGFPHRHSRPAPERGLSGNCDAGIRRNYQDDFQQLLSGRGQPRSAPALSGSTGPSGRRRQNDHSGSYGDWRHSENLHLHRRISPDPADPVCDLPPGGQPRRTGYYGHPGQPDCR